VLGQQDPRHDADADASQPPPRSQQHADHNGDGSLPGFKGLINMAGDVAIAPLAGLPSWRALGHWSPAENRPSPLMILREQERNRIPWLLPLRHERMAAGMFEFFRGGAAFMAADLACSPHSGILVQLCGDAHLLNFGFYASPERSLLFDIVDFDETYPGPFEWDLKRLLTSLVLVLQTRGVDGDRIEQTARAVAEHYRRTIAWLAGLPLMQMWGARIDLEQVLEGSGSQRFRRHLREVVEKARERDTLHAADRLCNRDSAGRLVFNHQPPALQRLEALPEPLRGSLSADQWSQDMIDSYCASAPSHVQQLLGYFEWRDWALKAVGVASVGTRCSIGLWVGPHEQDVLILQCKQALPSVLQPDPSVCAWAHQGQRVVEGQRLMQTHSDPFLGWATSPQGEDLIWRHFRDWKGAVDLEKLGTKGLVDYGHLCAWVLAKAHARSSKATPIAQCIADQPDFDQAMASFAMAYSQTVAADYRSFCEALAADGQLLHS
jgi:hypothetical protein